MNLKDKTVLVTGGDGGIGSVLVEKLKRSGANLVLTYGTEVDLAKIEDIDKFVEEVKSKYEQIDILINMAGVGIYKNIEDLTVDEFNYSFDLNTRAPFVLIKKLLPLLSKSSESVVMNIGSGAGVIPMKERSAYCTSKFALRGLTLSLAEEFEGKNPKFCLITLGSTLTGFGGVPIEKKLEKQKQGSAYFTPEFVADKLIEILSDDNRKTEVVLYPEGYGTN